MTLKRILIHQLVSKPKCEYPSAITPLTHAHYCTMRKHPDLSPSSERMYAENYRLFDEWKSCHSIFSLFFFSVNSFSMRRTICVIFKSFCSRFTHRPSLNTFAHVPAHTHSHTKLCSNFAFAFCCCCFGFPSN